LLANWYAERITQGLQRFHKFVITENCDHISDKSVVKLTRPNVYPPRGSLNIEWQVFILPMLITEDDTVCHHSIMQNVFEIWNKFYVSANYTL